MTKTPTARQGRAGKNIGSLLSSAVCVATGYVWAKYGLLYGTAVWGGFLVLCLAILGVVHLTENDA